MASSNAFSEFLEGQIKQRQMTPREFAIYIDVAPSTLSRALNPDRNNITPSIDFLMKLSKGTSVSIVTLLELVYPELKDEAGASTSSKALAEQIEQLPDPLKDAVMSIVRGAVTGRSMSKSNNDA